MTARCIIDFPCEDQPRLSGRFENPREVLIAQRIDQVLPLLQKVADATQAGLWAVGIVAYEAAPAFDPAFATHAPCPNVPLVQFALYDQPPKPFEDRDTTNFTCSPWQNDVLRPLFENKIDNIRADIAAGSYYQTNFTTRLHADFTGNTESLFHALRKAQPNGYSLFLDFADWQIASVSPELFFTWNPKTRKLLTRPMKGTSPLSETAENLQRSTKNRAENLMIVDLLRNDISQIADDVSVPELFTVHELSTIRQMTSTITGITRIDVGLPDIFKALFPCGSITGAPKIAAMQAIKSYEATPRGVYCGALGIIQPGGEATFSVGIRTVTISKNKATCGIGSGITWDSNPAEEYAENQIKQRFLWRATANFDLLETLRLENGVYCLQTRHEQRMATSAAHFGFVYNANAVRYALDTLANKKTTGLFRVRLAADRRGNIKTEVFPLDKSAEIVTVQLATTPINTDSDFIRHKTTNRFIYDAFKPNDPEIFDTLLFNERGEITEFTRGNVAVEIDGRSVTPPTSCGLLCGTLRAELLADGTLSESTIRQADLHRAKSIWFLNGLRGMIRVKLQ